MKKQLGKYEVIELLGRGGMAEVFKAYHDRLDRFVAIKVLHDFLAEDPEFEKRFEKEARNIARLRHTHIVQVYDFEYDHDNDSYYMVMEFINGITLKDKLYEPQNIGKPLDLKQALRIIREAASALAYAHRAGMIHRDVKPANLMLDSQEHDRVVLTDFGIAKLLTSSQYTVTGGIIGTPLYMAPEQGAGEIGDERSDIYSLGVIMFQLLTGRLPYEAEAPLALILKHLNDPIPSATEINPELPREVEFIIRKLLAKSPADRYNNASEVIADIEDLEKKLNFYSPHASSDASTPIGEFETIIIDHNDRPRANLRQPPAKDRNWMLIFISALFMIGIVTGAYVFSASQGYVPAVGFLASDTPTATATNTNTPTPTATATATITPSATNTATVTPSDTASPSATLTLTPSATASDMATPSATASPTRTITPRPQTFITATSAPSNTPTSTPNLTATQSSVSTATFAACIFDYAITTQEPEDGRDGPTIPINTTYTRQITFLNTGTCPWEVNTSLAFVEGESFGAGPRIVIRQEVPVGDEIVLDFEGITPSRGRLENGQLAPVEGTWQLRTRGQLPIGDAFIISVLVFDPGR